MIKLYIENTEIELTDNVQVAITSQFEDLSNPTDIINDWSKTVSIPFTANNNRIFGHIYCPDKTIVNGGTIGVYFNPLKKLDFRIEWNNNIVMIGYAKLNEVKNIAGKGTYEVTLFGELGKVFQEMKKITFDNSTDDVTYLIDGSKYVKDYISKDLVYNSWTSSGQTQSVIQQREISGTTNPNYSITDIIGFAPNNSFSEGFDYKTVQTSSNTTKSFSDLLGSGFTTDTGIEPDSVIPNGLLPREIGEYRSYLQIPYIYWNKLFQVFQEKAEAITGYNFVLDSEWFNTSNPYWYNLVYMLKPFDIKNGNSNVNTYSSTGYHEWTDDLYGDIQGGAFATLYPYSSTTRDVFEETRVISIDKDHINYDESVPLLSGNTFRVSLSPNSRYETNGFNINGLLEVYFASVPSGSDSSVYWQNFWYSPDVALNVNIKYTGANGYIYRQTGAVVQENTNTPTLEHAEACDVYQKIPRYPESTNYVYNDTSVKRYTGSLWNISLNYPSTPLLYSDFGDYVDIEIETSYWFPSAAAAQRPFGYINPPASFNNNVVFASIFNFNTQSEVVTNIFRSGARFTLNDLWNKEYNLFDAVLKYCKMFRISVSVDEFNKSIIFQPFTKYFRNYKVSDWTDKVDKSKDFVITPITFENKYILFNYKDSESKLAKEYKEKYGINYGEYRLVTDYNFNTETTKLFSDIPQSITNTDNVLSFLNLAQHNIVFGFPSEIFVYNKDKEKKQTNIFGSFYFHNGLANFNNELSLNLVYPVKISDDSAFMKNNDNYFYTFLQSDYTMSDTYPKLDIVNGNNMCVFNIPKDNYTYLNNYGNKKSIYSNFWVNYLDERYNIQNKKITCYMLLKPQDYNQFKWNNLIQIGKQICIVNKIYDYDITNNQPTKVDLITIQDITGYTTNNYA